MRWCYLTLEMSGPLRPQGVRSMEGLGVILELGYGERRTLFGLLQSDRPVERGKGGTNRVRD